MASRRSNVEFKKPKKIGSQVIMDKQLSFVDNLQFREKASSFRGSRTFTSVNE